MSKLSGNRLEYILGFTTQNQVMLETGIPQSTISRVYRGLRELPTKYLKELRNMYQRTVRFSLRSLGASSTLSNRFTWQSVTKVREVESFFKTLVDNKVDFYVNNKNEETGFTMDENELDTLSNSVKEGIIKNLSKSLKSYESLYDSL